MIFFKALYLLSIVLQTEIPHKPKEEYKVELEYQFKQRPSTGNSNRVDFELESEKTNKKKYEEGSLPYLIVNFKVIKLSDQEIRIRVIKNTGQTILNKKVEAGSSYKLDLGFTDDMKDRVMAHEFKVYFLNDKRKEVSVVTLFIGEDGTFLINDEVRGKF